ncbi:DUF930 domain-containing protein [Labrys monachus]|uniref:Pyruvate/2-oxoglutarate dehydrogenase complex dihydrolipoamide acyltransferase (E2) component n=1 Tax=Labrys monachus TaxID=217067 RepID=A0ABU0F8K5_9HYPH|nr:DUF930 domain-containing protein [Labrys monachus]MDQ0390692.1 pyruvate/2-oxoglutarate dehydrogenase complex dihydrolipoamide acyltransferase (E2) component [Labrys monachus]
MNAEPGEADDAEVLGAEALDAAVLGPLGADGTAGGRPGRILDAEGLPAHGRGWWAVVLAALAVHLAIAALVMFRQPEAQPQQEEGITVDLVPEPKPKPKPEAKAQAQAPPPAPAAGADKPKAPPAGQPPARGDAARQENRRAIKPVFRYGDKDAGPRLSRDGNSPQAGSAPAAAPDAPATTPQDAAVLPKPAKLREAKTLFSQSATSDLSAMTAMAQMPRGERAGGLCFTELREQLLHASPPYAPDVLPLLPLKEGTVLDIPGEAFRAGGQWYDLSYRCEVDANATKVVSFAFRVGEPIPRSDWQRRHLSAD